MLLEEPLNSLSNVCFIAILDIFTICDANKNFQKLKSQKSMLIIILIFIFFKICGHEICINNAPIDILV